MQMQSRDPSTGLKFEEQKAAEKAWLETQVAHLPHGPKRDALVRKIRELALTVHMNEWTTFSDPSEEQA
jgi:hypothetical protein